MAEKVELLPLVFVLPVKSLRQDVLCLVFLIWAGFVVSVALTRNLFFHHTGCMMVNQLSHSWCVDQCNCWFAAVVVANALVIAVAFHHHVLIGDLLALEVEVEEVEQVTRGS